MTYFERPATVAPIFAAFFVVFLSIAALEPVRNDHSDAPPSPGGSRA